MRIIHTCLRYPPSPGGTEEYVRQLVEGTRDIAAGRDVRVLTSSLQTHSPATPLPPDQLRDDPIYVQRLHHAATPLVSYPRLQALKYYLDHHDPDIIHGHSFWYQPADVAARFARRRNIPFILHPMFYTNAVRQKPLWQLYARTVGRATFAAADVVVVISPFEQQLIEQHGLPAKRFLMLPPSIDTDALAVPRRNPFAARGISGRIMLTASRLAPGKGLVDAIDVLPQLLQRHPDAQLVIAGADFGMRTKLLRRANARAVRPHVHLLGHLNREELIGAYQHADVFLHPSHYEAFGIVIAEALAAGTPVVARNTAAIPFVAPHAEAALLFSDAQEMASHLNTILSDRAAVEQLVSAGRRRVQQHFTWPAARASLLACYADIKKGRADQSTGHR